MNCLLSTLYVFWKTNSTNQGDYCYLLVRCGSFWTLQLGSGHHCVRHSAPPERKPGSPWERFGAEQTRQAEGGKGNAELREGTVPLGVRPGTLPNPEPCLQDHPPEMRKCPGFLCYIVSVDILKPYDVLDPILPLFPLLSPLVALVAEGYGPPGAKPCLCGVGRGHSGRRR